ncbi:hypothetical protein RCS94_05710 [Orbaceae bacterium ac157xtp]
MKIGYTFFCAPFLVLLLSGCELTGSRLQPSDNSKQPTDVVSLPPKIVGTDWNSILTPLINELLETAEVGENNQLLISDIKNNSNSYVSSAQLNKLIYNQLSSRQDIFKVIDKKTINQARQVLGISYNDALVSRSKMIALARNINADYLLFTTVNKTPDQDDSQAVVSMELLLTKTGEIVWQFSSDQLVKDNQTE